METDEPDEPVEMISCYNCSSEAPADDNNYEMCATKNNSEAYFCSDCYIYCSDCNTALSIHMTHDWRSYEDLCSSCEQDYVNCENCNERTTEYICFIDTERYVCNYCSRRVGSYCDECDEWYEEGCDHEDSETSGIYSHEYRPAVFLYHSHNTDSKNPVKGTPYLGLELEVEAVNSDLESGVGIVKSYDSDEKYVYLKTDGSLNYGFEIVTHPMTHDFAMEKFPWQLVEDLRRAGFRSWDTSSCGIHIHISRNAFADKSHLWKWSYLINKNANQCINLAGRESSYATFENGVKHTSDVILGKRGPASRYQAINLTNAKTIEVRIFKGSLRIPRVKTAFDFVQSSFEFTKDLPLKYIGTGTWDMFKQYVHEHNSRFENLNLRLNADKLVDSNA